MAKFNLMLVAFSLTLAVGAHASTEVRVAKNTGAIFTRDNSCPTLGEAFRDPSGAIWSGVAKENGEVKLVNFDEASAFCDSVGAELPTFDDFSQLQEYLGSESRYGYSPYAEGGKLEVLPNLLHTFWGAADPRMPDQVTLFSGRSGYPIAGSRDSNASAVRCIVRRR
jgi:hypothetical protein